MKFDFAEKIEYLHCVEIETENEELFEEVASDIAERLESGDIKDKEDVVSSFTKAFGENNVKFIEDGSGDVEFESY